MKMLLILNFSLQVLNYGGDSGEKGAYRGYGRAVDIWSVGCVIIHMVLFCSNIFILLFILANRPHSLGRISVVSYSDQSGQRREA